MKSQLFLLATVIALCSGRSPQNAVAVEQEQGEAVGVAERVGAAGESHSDVQNDYYYIRYPAYMAGGKGVYYSAVTYSQYNKMALELTQCLKEKDELMAAAASEDLQEEAQPGAEEEKEEDKDDSQVCSLKPDSGPCRAYIQKYYYNDETKKCEKFTYGGCQGNGNRFETKKKCEAKCIDTCKQPVTVGNCYALLPRYYYSSLTGKCEFFFYGGCGGNKNNFLTMQQCQTTCDGACVLPAERGPCLSTIPRWYHNAETGQCEVFIYGGCGGNSNNFLTKDLCDAQC